MKKLMLLAVLSVVLATQLTKAQTVKGKKISEITAEYVEVTTYQPPLSNKIGIRLEYGQKVLDWFDDTVVKDDTGKTIDFESALNFISLMKRYGYELFQVHVTVIDDIRPLKYYILKRRNTVATQ